MTSEALVLVALGSNLGDREAALRSARDGFRAAAVPGTLSGSSIYATDPVGGPPQAEFLNAVLRFEARVGPEGLLAIARGLEQDAGRIRRVPDGPRPLDVDILLFGQRRVSVPGLEIPHPRMLGRAFVLVPAAEIAPEMTHPGTGSTLRLHLAGLGRVDGVRCHAPRSFWESDGDERAGG